MSPNKVELILHTPDFGQTINFYSRLGFKVLQKRVKGDVNDCLFMEHEGAIISFWPGNKHVRQQPYFKNQPGDTKRGFGVEIAIISSDIDSLFEVASNFANIVEPLKTQPWGARDFRLEDPFGFYLRFSEPYNLDDYVKVA